MAELNDNAIIHLYRGELGRMTLYRIRLDTTTNWAFGANAAIISLGLGGKSVPHPLFALAVLLNLAFVWMEARRFRGYEMLKRRVRLLERGYFAPQLDPQQPDGWREELAQSLHAPEPPISYLQAASVRMRRNYLLLMALDYVGWLFKLHRDGGVFSSAEALGLPAPAVLILAAVLFALMVALALYHRIPEEG